MKQLIVIDGNSLLFKAFYATSYSNNYMENKDGIPTNGVFGFAKMIDKILEDHQTDSIIVAFDYGKETFRNKIMDSYKANRKSAPEELIPQFNMAREYLVARNIPYYELQGYEGDDLIGTIAKKAEKEDYQVKIFTGDKDAFQLASSQITICRTVKGVSELDIYSVESINEKYGLKPDQIRDFLGLMGDTADNIPGIKGVGEKTALKLLHEYETIENLAIHKDEIKGKLGEKIRDGIDQAILSKEIATILTDVPFDFEITNYQGYDKETLKAFYQKYDMNSLLKALNKDHSDMDIDINIVHETKGIKTNSSLYVSLYEELNHHSPIMGFSVYSKEESYFISFEDALKDELFLQDLKNKEIVKYGYHIKEAMIACMNQGIEINGFDFDLSLATYVLEASIKDDFNSNCDYYDYSNVYYDEEVYGKGAKKHIPEIDILAKDGLLKAKAIYQLKDEAINKLKEANQYDLYYHIELPVTYILKEMELTGMKVNPDVLKQMDQEFDLDIEKLSQSIYEDSGEEFNISSTKQLGEILFEKMGLKPLKKTKTGYSTSQDILEKLKDEHPIIEKILNYRFYTKLSSTYLKGLQDYIEEDGKIHTLFKQTLTQTGRLSSIEPNLQNIPVKSEEGKKIRKAFESNLGYLVSFDYSQIELRILAHLAKVEKLQEAFHHGKDIHAHTAALVFGVEEDKVTPLMRRQAKAVNFGIIYGMTEFRLAKDIGMSLNDAREFIEKYYATYPEIKVYMDQMIATCKKEGYVTTLLNRKRFIPTINDKNFLVREQAKRYAMNAPIQGSGADIMKLSMIQVDKMMKEKGYHAKIVLQIHDELIFDVPKEELEAFMKDVKEAMESCIELSVPLIVEGNYANNWCDLK